MNASRMVMAGLLTALMVATGYAATSGAPTPAQGIAAFQTIEEVFQHPRCSNCHIPGDSPLQFDAQTPHMMNVVRGPEGAGTPSLPCSSCHGTKNSPATYGPHAPPGAPNWHLPPPNQKMAWIDLPAAQLCAVIKDRKHNGDRDLDAMLEHVRTDKLVLWGWNPGGNRQPVSVPHAEFVAAFRTWMDAGAPCPD